MSAKSRILPVFIPHMGCPHDCVFCNQRRISGTLQPAECGDVLRILEDGLKVGGEPPQLAFYGGSFTAIPRTEQQLLLDAAQPYLKRGAISGIRLSTRPDAVDRDELTFLKQYGVDTIELGAQSMDASVLLASARGHTAEDTKTASRLIKSSGFSLILQMMTGLPGSNDEIDVITAEQIIRLQPDGVRIYPTVIIRDTRLYDLWQQGLYREHSVEDAVRVCARIFPLFRAAGIPVIRLGLNPTDELSGGAAAGGAYHPALGELVKSRILLEQVRAQLCGRYDGKKLTLCVAQKDVSQMVGQRRCNMEALEKEYGFTQVCVKAQSMENGGVHLHLEELGR